MELLLLGTAAAEGWPAPFCECTYCQQARRRGGPNLRSRSGALVDDDLKIDLSADTVVQMQRAQRSLAGLKTLVFSHQHSDHISPSELNWMVSPFTQTPPAQPIAVYGNQQVLAILREKLADSPKLAPLLELHLLEPFQAVTTPDGDQITPLPADHVEGALLLRLTRSAERGGKTLFYGHDSGFYPAATLDALEAGPTLDIVLLDCTSGGRPMDNRNHMNCDGVVQMTDELRRRGVVTETTRVIATHFSHNGGLLHEELGQRFAPHGIAVAFDGMKVRV